MTEVRGQGSGIRPLPALRTLKKRSDFLTAAKGKRWVTPGFTLQSMPAEGLHFGLTASGKIGNAVVRNRAKRRLRALAHEILPQHAKDNQAYVLVARKEATSRDYADLKKDFLWALRKLEVAREA